MGTTIFPIKLSQPMAWPPAFLGPFGGILRGYLGRPRADTTNKKTENYCGNWKDRTKKVSETNSDGILQFLNHSVWFCWTLNFNKKENWLNSCVCLQSSGPGSNVLFATTVSPSRTFWVVVWLFVGHVGPCYNNPWEGLLGHHGLFPCFHHLTLPQARRGGDVKHPSDELSYEIIM